MKLGIMAAMPEEAETLKNEMEFENQRPGSHLLSRTVIRD